MSSIRISMAAGPLPPFGNSLSRKLVASTTSGFWLLEIGSSSLSTSTWMLMLSSSRRDDMAIVSFREEPEGRRVVIWRVVAGMDLCLYS